jgi:hypothetical protein
MSRAEFDPMGPMFEHMKTVRTLDRAAIGTGQLIILYHLIYLIVYVQEVFPSPRQRFMGPFTTRITK